MNLRAHAYRIVWNSFLRARGFPAAQVFRFLKKSQWWSRDQITELQNREVKKLIEHAYEYVPYYRTMMNRRGLKPKDIQTTDDLVKMPILTKDVLRENWNEIISTNVSFSKTRVRKTGGSTGEPLKIINSYTNGAWEYASAQRGWGFYGFRAGEQIIQLFGGSLGLKPESLRKRLLSTLSGVVSLPAIEIGPKTLGSFVTSIRKSGAKFIRGYASAIYLLSKLVKEYGLDIQFKAAFPTAEVLYDYQRDVIKEGFQCDVYDQYGCGELNSIAFECPTHSGLHISDEHVFVESLIDGRRVSGSEMGALSFTTLHQFAMPLIRYQNGDIVSVSTKQCNCGRGLSLIKKIYGRANDMLLAKDGRLVSSSFLPSFCVNAHFEGVQQFQIIQETKKHIRVKIVKTDKFEGSGIDPLFEVLHRYLGDLEITVEFVDSIPKTRSHKHKYVISKVI